MEAELTPPTPVKADAPTEPTGQRTPVSDPPPTPDKVVTDPDPSKPDTQATADKEVETAKAEAEKEGKELDTDDKGVPKRDAAGKFVRRDKKPVETPMSFTPDEEKKFLAWSKQTQSRYAHDITKQLVRWDKIKTAEAALTTTAETNKKLLDSRIAQFNADVNAFRTERDSATPTPERYEAFALKCSNDAKIKLAEAITAENEGRIEDAEKLRDEAKFLNRDAANATASAEHLKKNPPPTVKQQQEKFVADQKSWITQAATDYPEFAKRGSPVQVATAEVFKAITAKHPETAKLPGLVYYCARIAQAETAAARVPVLEKELGETKTKLTELEALTNPTPSGGVQRQPAAKSSKDMTPDEQFEQLQSEAKMMTV